MSYWLPSYTPTPWQNPLTLTSRWKQSPLSKEPKRSLLKDQILLPDRHLGTSRQDHNEVVGRLPSLEQVDVVRLIPQSDVMDDVLLQQAVQDVL